MDAHRVMLYSVVRGVVEKQTDNSSRPFSGHTPCNQAAQLLLQDSKYKTISACQ